MVNCSYAPDVECTGVTHGKEWTCPIHKASLNAHYTRLCRTNPKHYKRWVEGCGAGQPQPERTRVVGKRGGCGRNKRMYDPDDQEFALSKCRKCVEYDAGQDLCTVDEDKPKRCRYLLLTCTARLEKGIGGCPLMWW